MVLPARDLPAFQPSQLPTFLPSYMYMCMYRFCQQETAGATGLASSHSIDEWAVVDVPDVPMPSQSEEINLWEASLHPTAPPAATRKGRSGY